jgi:uncharacterized protein (DUF1330 family)
MATLNAIDPTPEQIRAFLAHEQAGEPVFMLNLLKFKTHATYSDRDSNPENDVSGEVAYGRYASAFGKLMRERNIGFETTFAGNINAMLIGQDVDATQWDKIAIAKYPDAKTMFECVSSEDYRKIHYHRKAGLEGQLLISCSAAKGF